MCLAVDPDDGMESLIEDVGFIEFVSGFMFDNVFTIEFELFDSSIQRYDFGCILFVK